MHTRFSRTSLLVLTWITLAVVAWPVRGCSAEGTLTGCKIEAYLVDKYGPQFPNEASRAHVSARYTNPKASAECGMTTGPTWAWTIRSVERLNPMTMAWEPHTYRPNLGYPHRQRALVSAYFPVGGAWRVTLDVKAVWTSEACSSCEDTSFLVIDFPDVSNCSFVGEVAFTDEFQGRRRTAAGLMEEGTLSVRFAEGTVLADVAPLTWTIRSGFDSKDSFVDTGNGTATFQASYNIGQIVFELKSGKTGCVATVTLDVVAPSGVVHTFDSFRPGNGVNAGKINFQIRNTVHILPNDVSFSKIQCGEGEDPEADMNGELKRVAIRNLGEKAPHNQNGPFGITVPTSLSEGSCWNTLDQIGPGTIDENGEAGHFIWEIPQQWFGALQSRNDFSVLTQRHDFDGKRTIRIQKGGVDKSGP
jgi:hypothetical protein